MKTGIHPQLMDTKVTCNGCGVTFVTRATVPTITVEICSLCHPFYTGKQKLVDTAGRVDKFKQRAAAAQKLQAVEAKRVSKKAAAAADSITTTQENTEAIAAQADADETTEVTHIAEELKTETVDLPVGKKEAGGATENVTDK